MASSFRNFEKDFYKKKQDKSPLTLSPSKSKSKPKPFPKSKLTLSPLTKTPKQTRDFNLKTNFGNINSVSNNYGNININVNNYIINNNNGTPLGFTPSNNINHTNVNNYNLYFTGNSVFSKIGYDIAGKTNKSIPKKKVNVSPNNNNNINNGNNLENVIQNLIGVTKDNNNNSLKEGISGQTIINTNNSNACEFNPLIWECLFDLELLCDKKQAFSMVVHKLLNLLSKQLTTKDIPLDLFTIPHLNLGYSKLIKISFIFLTYLKYILLDFIYDVSLKSILKKILTTYNSFLLQIIENFIYQKSNLITFSEDLTEKYIKLSKMRRTKKNQGTLNPVNYGTSLHKNIDAVITNIKQFSTNYFKIGYFKPIHTICFEFFRLIDSFTPYTLVNLIINHVLFFVIHNNPNEKHNNTIANKNVVFNPTSLLSLYGFNTGNVKEPFLPPEDPNKYTLILDLDETLIHFFFTPSGGAFLIRPHCFEFLEEMSTIFDIAIFTAGMKDYADSILDILDPNKKWIKHRLYRHHTSIAGMCFVKDLSKLGRDLNKVIIIDNLAENFKLQPNNGLDIKTWTDEMKDSQLLDIGNMLKELISKRPSDVRVVLKKIKEEVTQRIRKNCINPYKNISVDKYIN